MIAPPLPWYRSFIFNLIPKLLGVQDVQSTVTIAEKSRIRPLSLFGAVVPYSDCVLTTVRGTETMYAVA